LYSILKENQSVVILYTHAVIISVILFKAIVYP